MSKQRVPGRVTVIGGGLGGLIAAITAREAGWDVTLHEAHADLGGRARSHNGPHRANWGPHVVYSDGALWQWLDERGLAKPAGKAPLTGKVLFRSDDRLHRMPPLATTRALLKLRSTDAPVDQSYADWARSVVGDERAAAQAVVSVGVFTFDHDPGRLSARFVQERLRRATAVPLIVRYIPGGWGAMVERIVGRGRQLGVTIETQSRVDVMPEGPTIVALPLDRASALLGDPSIEWTGTRTALLDLAVQARRRDPFVILDLDSPGWVEAYSKADRTLAPAGEHLIQAQTGLRPGESLDEGVGRIEHLLDLGYRGWRERETWRRRARIVNESGALDLPGTTWRDRPAIDRGDGMYLVGDMVAAPGLLGEVSVASALSAVRSLTGQGSATESLPTVGIAAS